MNNLKAALQTIILAVACLILLLLTLESLMTAVPHG